MTSEVNRESEQFEMDEEIAVKEKLNPDSASPSKVKFTAAADGKNGEAKVDVDKGYGGSVGMSKEELMKYANDPFWVRLRMFLFILFWVVWFAMLIGAVVIIAVAPKCPASSSLTWWQKTTAYQVYVRSFKDSNNDGEGDIAGLISKLDYFKDIGVETLILSPIYPSGGRDDGYDVTNHIDIDPKYGTLEQFDDLVNQMHSDDRNMKIIIDFIPNHTSDRHPWFNASQSGDPEFKDYYIWHSGNTSAGARSPPNNWKSVWGGSAWTWSDKRQQYYFHQFMSEEPDLNLRNPGVKQALKEVIQFWLRRKVDGIRIDSAAHLNEALDQSDESVLSTKPFGNDYYTLKHDKTIGLEDNFEILKEWRKVVKKAGLKKILLSEANEPIEQLVKYYGAGDDPIIDLPLNPNLLEINYNSNANSIQEKIQSWYSALDSLKWPANSKPAGPWSAWTTGNQDSTRLVTRIDKLSDGILMLVLTLARNTPVVYYGDEIGMSEGGLTPQKTLDSNSQRLYQKSPMQWNGNTSSAGFSDSENVTTWLTVPNTYEQINVESQLNEKHSKIKLFKGLVGLRKAGMESILLGKTAFPYHNSTDNVLVMSRTSEGQKGYVLAINFNAHLIKTVQLEDQSLPQNGKILLTDTNTSEDLTGKEIKLSEFSLQPSQSILIEFEPKLE